MKKEIQKCLTWLANMSSQVIVYENWSDEHKTTKTKEVFNVFYEELKKHIDFNNLTVEEANELRFGRWSEELPNLWLFPLYLIPIIPEGLEIIYIDGEKGTFKKDEMDNDIRFGCVPYGIEIKAEE